MFCLLEMRQSPGIFWLLLNLSSSIKNRRVVSIIVVVVVVIVTSLLVKVNYNYFTLYKASSLNLKVITLFDIQITSSDIQIMPKRK